MRVIDRITVCDDGKHRTIDPRHRRAIVLHRCGVGESAVEISQAFQAPGQAGAATGYQMPYTLVILRSGTIEQALRIGDCAPHARRWNVAGIGVGIVGDMRSEPCTPAQYDALVSVCCAFAGWLGGCGAIWAHDELANATGDPAKVCPGPHLDMHRLRSDVLLASQSAIESSGFVF